MKGTCLSSELYDLEATGAVIEHYPTNGSLNDIAPTVINGAAETTLLDIPSALVALQKWPGEIKIIGPISRSQLMGVAFAKPSQELLDEFNRFFRKCWREGSYKKLVKKYYPAVFLYLDDFFNINIKEK